MSQRKLCILLIILALKSYNALYENSQNVIELNSKNFEPLVLKGEEIWIVEFYAPWCNYCQLFEPEYNQIANSLVGIIKVGAVNADENKDLSRIYEVKELPTIKIFGANKLQPENYNGLRTSQQLIDTVLNVARDKAAKLQVESQKETPAKYENIVELTDENFDELILQTKDIWMVYFYTPLCGNCKNLEPQWAEAAESLKVKVKFGKIDSAVNKNKAKVYNIETYPAIKFFPTNKEFSYDYDGGRNASEIVEWVNKNMYADITPPKLVEIIDHHTLVSTCEHKDYSIVSFFPNLERCKSKCRWKYLNMLKNVTQEFKVHKWCWIWAGGSDQPQLESVFELNYRDFPAIVAADYKKKVYVKHRGTFSEKKISEFLRHVIMGKGKFIRIYLDDLPIIFANPPWDGKDIDYGKDEL